MQTEVGVFRSRAAAEQAIRTLLDSGISSQSMASIQANDHMWILTLQLRVILPSTD